MSARLRLPNPLAALDDRALLARFADECDQPAFEQLVKRHGTLVYGVCKRTVRDPHLAEDAFQAVFLVLARNPTGALSASSVGGWLFGVARRVGLAARRSELRRARLAIPAPPEPTEGQAERADFDDLLRVLDEELAAIPDGPRAALVACFLQERTQDEAARELGWSLSTLRRRLERGKELLRSRLARRGVALGVGLLAGGAASPSLAAIPPITATPSATSAALAAEVVRGGAVAKLLAAKLLAAAAGLVLAGGALAFGLAGDWTDEPDPHTPTTRKANPPPLPLAPAPRAVEAKRWVNVSGRVVFPKGEALPKVKLVPADGIKDPDVWKAFMPLRYENVLIEPKNRGIANAVVFLRSDSDDRKAKFPADRIHPALRRAKGETHTVFASGGQFTPRVLGARAGDSVTFSNILPVPTNVHYQPVEAAGAERLFNILIGKGMSYTGKPLPAMRFPDVYDSSIYPWMRGYVWAFDHPYFSVTDANGRFEIPDAPAGKWRLVVWHEAVGWLGGKAGSTGTKVTLPAGPAGAIELAPLTFESANWGE